MTTNHKLGLIHLMPMAAVYPYPDSKSSFFPYAGKAIKWYKMLHPCIDCGESDSQVLQFDHLSQYRKMFNISRGGVYCTREVLWAEIQKCEIVCANCHIRRTNRRKRHLI